VKSITILVEDTDQATDICRMLSHAEAVGELDFSFNVSVTDTEPEVSKEPEVVITYNRWQFFEDDEVTDKEWSQLVAEADDMDCSFIYEVIHDVMTAHLESIRSANHRKMGEGKEVSS